MRITVLECPASDALSARERTIVSPVGPQGKAGCGSGDSEHVDSTARPERLTTLWTIKDSRPRPGTTAETNQPAFWPGNDAGACVSPEM